MHLITDRRPVRRPRVPALIDLADTLRFVTPEFSKRAGLAATFPPIAFLLGEDALKFTSGLGDTFDDSSEYTRQLIEAAEQTAEDFDGDADKARAELWVDDDAADALAKASEWAATRVDEDPLGTLALRYDFDTDDLEDETPATDTEN